MKYVSINVNDVKKMFKVCGACLDTDGATSITTRYLANYIEWEQVFKMSTPKQPAQIGINAKMLAEILNAIKDYGDNKRVVITIDADSATRPVFIETPDGSAKTMLCTCRGN